MSTKTLIALFAVIGLIGFSHATTVVTIEDGATVDVVASGYNGHTGGTSKTVSTANHMLDLGTGVTVKLDSAAAEGGVFTLFANINSTKGEGDFTVDATGIDTIRWVGGVSSAGQVTVKGAKQVVFGELDPVEALNTAYFKADLSFEAGDAKGVTFTNSVTCAAYPSSCAYGIADGTVFAACAAGMFGNGEDEFAVDRFSITLLNASAISAPKFIIGKGRTVTFRPCYVSLGKGVWSWAGSENKHLLPDIEIGSGGKLTATGSLSGNTFDGKITGVGTIEMNGSFAYAGQVNLSGDLQILGSAKPIFSGAGPFEISTLRSRSVNGNIQINAGTTVSVVKVSDSATLQSGGTTILSVYGEAGGCLTVGTLGKIDVHVYDPVKFKVLACSQGASIIPEGDGPWCVAGPDSEPSLALPLVHPTTTGHEIAFGGHLELGDLGTTYGTVRLLPGAVLTGTTFDSSVKFAGNGVIPTGNWKEKVALWLDASDEDSFEYASENPDWATATASYFRDGNPIVWKWHDCRGNQYYLHNARIGSKSDFNSYSAKFLPTRSTNTTVSTSGLAFVDMNATSAHAQIRTGSTPTTTEINAKNAIVVFGSQGGGGGAILGATNGELARKAYNSGTNAGSKSDLAKLGMMTNDTCTVYADGAPVAEPTTTKFTGGWQILSLDFGAGGLGLNGFGFANFGSGTTPGGRGMVNYAEALLFSEAPTEAERKIAEKYLADKWALPCAHEGATIADTKGFALGTTPTETAILDYGTDDAPRTLTVNLDLTAKPDAGRYALIKNIVPDSYALGTVDAVRGRSVSLSYDAATKTLYADVIRDGMLLIVR